VVSHGFYGLHHFDYSVQTQNVCGAAKAQKLDGTILGGWVLTWTSQAAEGLVQRYLRALALLRVVAYGIMDD
jgi:hypothetical protein